MCSTGRWQITLALAVQGRSTTLLLPVLSQMISSDRNLCGRYSCFQFAVFSPSLKAAVAECSKSARAGLKQVLQPGFVALACEV